MPKEAMRAWGASMIALSWAWVVTPAHAQDGAASNPAAPAQEAASASPAAEEQNAIGDIVVTAQRRTENLQKSSLAIAVVGADQLRAAGSFSPIELGKLVAGVQVSIGAATPQIYIRGVGDFGATAQANPAVAFNIDGVYVARQQAIGSAFFDVARMEVLKGPQGTLYGRNATGGAINLITNQPKLGQLAGTFNLQVGNYNLLSVDGAVNVPVGNDLAIRAAYQVTDRKGYVSKTLDDDVHQSVRLQALWEPTTRFSLLLAADYSHVGGNGAASVAHPTPAGLSPWTATAISYSALVPQVNAFLFPGALKTLNLNDNFQNSQFWSVHAEANYDFGFAKLTFLPAYRDAKMRYLTQNAYDYNIFLGAGPYKAVPESSKATSAELRLSADHQALKWVVGAYYFDEDQYAQYGVDSGLIQKNYTIQPLKTRNYAAFGETTVTLVEGIRLIAGGRYTSDRRQIVNGSGSNRFPSARCANPGVPLCLSESLNGSKTFNNFSWKFGAEADLSPANMLFATVSRGFKGGGFNANVGVTPGSTTADSYEPEVLTAYTIGSRNRFFDNRLQVNLELFYWDYKNHQEASIAVDGQNNLVFRLSNAGAARQYGASLDVIAKLSAADTLQFSGEYLNAKYTDFKYNLVTAFYNPAAIACPSTPAGIPGLTTINCSGYQLTRAPTWSGNASYAHVFGLANGGDVRASGDLTFASSRWLSTDFIANERADGYVTFNASLGYTTPDGKLSVTGFIRNITKEAVFTGGLEAPFIPGFVGAQIAAPRTYGLRVSTKF